MKNKAFRTGLEIISILLIFLLSFASILAMVVWLTLAAQIVVNTETGQWMSYAPYSPALVTMAKIMTFFCVVCWLIIWVTVIRMEENRVNREECGIREEKNHLVTAEII